MSWLKKKIFYRGIQSQSKLKALGISLPSLNPWFKLSFAFLCLSIFASTVQAQQEFHYQCPHASHCELNQSFSFNDKEYSIDILYTGWPRQIKVRLQSFDECELEQEDSDTISNFSQRRWSLATYNGEKLDFDATGFIVNSTVYHDQGRLYLQLEPKFDDYSKNIRFYITF